MAALYGELDLSFPAKGASLCTVLEAWAMKELGLRREDISHPSMKTEMQTKESMGTIGRHRLLVLKKIARDSEPELVWQVGR